MSMKAKKDTTLPKLHKLQSKKTVERKIKPYNYKIQRTSDGSFLVSKILNGKVLSKYIVELHGSCTCPDFKQRRSKNNQACKHIQMVLNALAEYPSFEQVSVFFDENSKKLLYKA